VWALLRDAGGVEHRNSGAVYSVAYSPDSQRVLAQGVILESRTGAVISRPPRTIGPQSRSAWSPKDDLIGGLSKSHLVDSSGQTKLELTPGPAGGLGGVTFSNDGQLVAGLAVNGSVTIWNTSDGKALHAFRAVPITQEANPPTVACLAFNPGGKLLGVGTYRSFPKTPKQGSLHVRELHTGRVLFHEDFSLYVWGIAFSPDGKLLAAAMGYQTASAERTGQVRVWDTQTWQVVHRFHGHVASAYTLCFSPDGKRLASVAGLWGSKTPGEVKLWDVTTGEELWSRERKDGGTYGVAFSPDGQRLVISTEGGVVTLLDGTPLLSTPSYEPLPENP
jgi:WD40 repeat protein